MLKIFVYTPKENIDSIISAMANAGAGIIGNYSHNAFITKGMGNWLPLEGSNPTVGEIGKMSREVEYKVEMTCPEEFLDDVIDAIKSVHPYETPAIDVVKLFP